VRFVADVLVVLGTIGGIASIWLFAKNESEVGSKVLGVSIGLLAVGVLLVRAT
jgi:hypothetical protein